MRCQCKNLSNKYVCKNPADINVCYLQYRICVFHLKYYYNKYAIIIQKIYIGYKHRKILTNIYKKLPDDIQYKIRYYIRYDLYYKRYLGNLRNVLNKKILTGVNFITKLANDELLYNYILNNVYNLNNLHNLYIITIYKLYNKYNPIISELCKEELIRCLWIIYNTIRQYRHNNIDSILEYNIIEFYKTISNYMINYKLPIRII